MNPGGLDWEARLPTTKLSLTYDLPYYTSVRPSVRRSPNENENEFEIEIERRLWKRKLRLGGFKLSNSNRRVKAQESDD